MSSRTGANLSCKKRKGAGILVTLVSADAFREAKKLCWKQQSDWSGFLEKHSRVLLQKVFSHFLMPRNFRTNFWKIRCLVFFFVGITRPHGESAIGPNWSPWKLWLVSSSRPLSLLQKRIRGCGNVSFRCFCFYWEICLQSEYEVTAERILLQSSRRRFRVRKTLVFDGFHRGLRRQKDISEFEGCLMVRHRWQVGAK